MNRIKGVTINNTLSLWKTPAEEFQDRLGDECIIKINVE